MKKLLTSLGLISILCVFSLFISINDRAKPVLKIFSPTRIGIDFDKNKIIEPDEIVCTDNIETFSLEPSNDFYEKYSKKFNLNKIDIISLGYLAQEYTIKSLLNKNVSVKFSPKVTNECKYADIKINGLKYSDIFNNSGFGIKNETLINPERFKKQLEEAKKLKLVILNHKSEKYHTLDCPYGNAAHDMIIIPQKDLPKTAKPCKFCHQEKEKTYTHKKGIDVIELPKLPQPQLKFSEGNIKFIITDYTKTLKPNKNCSTIVCKELVELINRSKSSIDIAIYGYDEIPAITKALINAKTRGVNIRFVYDENFDPNKTYYKSNNIIKNISTIYTSDKTSSKTSSNMLMHNKFVIFDNQKVFTGSMNFSSTGLSDFDINDIIIINSNEIASLYFAEFEQMINGKFHKSKQKHSLNNKFVVDNSVVEIYFSPQDDTSQRICEIIKNSKKYIYIPTFLITHKDITNELIKAKQRGIDVRIIIDANSTGTRNSKHAILRENNILLKTEIFAGKLHSKTMIIDDEYIITGSMNFSNSGENKNDENVLIIKNSNFAQKHKNYFLYLWTLIPNKYLKHNAKPESFDSIGSCYDRIDNNFNGKVDQEEELCR